MKDAGYKPKKESMDCGPLLSSDVRYPSIYLNAKNAPDLKGYDTEDSVTLLIKGVITGHSINKRNKKEQENFDIEIKKIACIDKK